MVFVFDELPYAAQAAPSLPSTLQILIDHEFKQTNICMILCGSNEGFMESNVLGRKSPLYGRRNAQIKLLPFDCFDAALMMPGYTPQQCIELYAMLGGTPYYLEQIDPNASIGENTERLFFDIAGLLYAEPQMLLRQELREPALYTSVLDAIASGATAPKAIANKAGVEETSVGKYLATLIGLDLIEKITPFEAGPRSRRSIYRIKDPFFAFWYRFVSPQIGAIEVAPDTRRRKWPPGMRSRPIWEDNLKPSAGSGSCVKAQQVRSPSSQIILEPGGERTLLPRSKWTSTLLLRPL